MAKNAIKGITISLGGDTVGLEKALAGVNKTSAALNSELRQVNNSLKFDPTNTTLLAQKQEILSQQVKNTSEKLRELKSAQSQVEEQYKSGKIGEDAYRAFQREVVNTENTLRSLEQEQKNVGKASDEAKEKTADFSTALNAVNLSADLFTSAAGVIVTGLVSITTEAIDAGKAFVSMVDDVGKAGDAIDKNSQKAGMSAEAYQEWGYVLQRNGASADSLASYIKKLNNNVDDAASGSENAIEKFKRLGISTDDLQSKSREDVFAEVIAGLQNMENESERAAVLNDLLGGSATELGALLNQTAEDTKALRENAHSLGLVMSNEGVSDSAAYADALLDLQSAFTGVKNRIGSDILPSFTQVLEGLTGMIVGTKDSEKSFEDGVEGIAQKISSLAPNAGETAVAISTAIANEIPQLVSLSTSMTSSISSALTSNAPALAKSAGTILQALASGFVANTSTILGAVTEIGDEVLKVLPEYLGGLISSGGTFAGAIVSFLTRSVVIVGERLPEILSKLTEGVSSTLPMLTAGLLRFVVQSVQALTALIPQILPDLLTMVTGVVTAILPMAVNAAVMIVQALVQSAPAIVEVLAKSLPTIITGLLTAVLSQLPTIITGLTSITGSIAEALPEIINSGIIESIVMTLIDSIPIIAECGVQLMISLVENLPEINKGITEAIPRIIVSIVGSIEKLHGELVEAGSEALLKLVEKCPDVIRIVKQKAHDIVQSISDEIYSKYGDLIDAGYNLITGMWQGIENAKDWIIGKISGFTDDIVNSFKEFFDIHSPSHRIEAEIGEYNGIAIGTGTVKVMPKVRQMIKDSTQSLFDDSVFNPKLVLPANDERMRLTPLASGYPTASVRASGEQMVINFTMHIDTFNNSSGLDFDRLMDRAMNTLYQDIVQLKLAR